MLWDLVKGVCIKCMCSSALTMQLCVLRLFSQKSGLAKAGPAGPAATPMIHQQKSDGVSILYHIELVKAMV